MTYRIRVTNWESPVWVVRFSQHGQGTVVCTYTSSGAKQFVTAAAAQKWAARYADAGYGFSTGSYVVEEAN